jgi:hypothetical protein
MLCHSDFQRGILSHDSSLQPPKIPPRVDPKLVGQQRPCPPICGQGFALPAGAIEGQHQLAPSSFAQRRLGHRCLELPDDLRGAARRKQRIGPVLDQRGMALTPASLFRYSPMGIGQLGGSAPEGQRLLVARHRLADVASGGRVASHSGRHFVARGIDIGARQDPSRSLRQHDAVAESATQRGDVRLEGLVGRARRVVTPEQLDEVIGRDNRTTVQPEHREDGARFGARDRDRHVPPNLERSQNPQLHRWKRSHVAIVGGAIQHAVKEE